MTSKIEQELADLTGMRDAALARVRELLARRDELQARLKNITAERAKAQNALNDTLRAIALGDATEDARVAAHAKLNDLSSLADDLPLMVRFAEEEAKPFRSDVGNLNRAVDDCELTIKIGKVKARAQELLDQGLSKLRAAEELGREYRTSGNDLTRWLGWKF